MSASAVVIKLLASALTSKDGRKGIAIALIAVAVIITMIIGIVMIPFVLITTKPEHPYWKDAEKSVRKELKIIPTYTLPLTIVRGIYLFHTWTDVFNQQEAEAFIKEHFVVDMFGGDAEDEPVKRFTNVVEIFLLVQKPPFEFDDIIISIMRENGGTTGGGAGGDLPIEIMGKLIKPCGGGYTSMFGERTHPVTGEPEEIHTGIDIQGEHHQPIVATASGVVISTNTATSGYGNYVLVQHTIEGTTFYSFYAHLSKITVSPGQSISQGAQLGLEGGEPNVDINPGTSTGHHLHFELRTTATNKSVVDPYPYLELTG